MTTTQEMINDLHASLVTEQPNITVLEYVKVLNEKIFNIDISFIDDFIELVDKEGFIIHHSMLEKYGILKIQDTYYIKRLLEQYEFEEDHDFVKIAPPRSGGQSRILFKE